MAHRRTDGRRGYPVPEDLSYLAEVRNPLGLEALQPILGLVQGGFLLLVLSIIGCVVSLIQRFRRSHGVERLQLKWLTASGAATGMGSPV